LIRCIPDGLQMSLVVAAVWKTNEFEDADYLGGGYKTNHSVFFGTPCRHKGTV